KYRSVFVRVLVNSPNIKTTPCQAHAHEYYTTKKTKVKSCNVMRNGLSLNHKANASSTFNKSGSRSLAKIIFSESKLWPKQKSYIT
ncbi:MAG: hypothetical protein IKS59_03450, partial [Aeriscardovia sp.]|nr:hypothetical protein [Aeriscardovia sp.]